MKKLLFSACMLSMMAFVACGDDKKDEDGEEGKDGKSSGPGLCDCVNMDMETADDKLKDACKEMEKEWKDKYENASDEEKKELMEKVKDCEG